MNVATLLMPLLSNLIEKVISNQFTKQNLHNEMTEITKTMEDHVVASHVEKSSKIQILEQKLKDLTGKLDSIIDVKVDEVVKKVQDKTPFFLDPIVERFGTEIKHQVDVFTDDAVEKVLDFLLAKAKEHGLEHLLEVAEDFILPSITKSEPVKTEVTPEVVTKDEDHEVIEAPVEHKTGNTSDFLSDHAQEILDGLKDKHKND